MSWLFPLSKSGASSAAGGGGAGGLTSLQQQRQRLIESLRAAHASLAEIEKDAEFRLPFTVNNVTIAINIPAPCAEFTMHSDLGKIVQSLLDEFWKSPPVLIAGSVFPPLNQGLARIPPYAAQGFPFLPLYPPQEASRAVASVPVADAAPPAPTYSAPRPAAPSCGFLSSLPLPVPTTEAPGPMGQNGCGYKMPDIPEGFPELTELSMSQLTDMNEREDAFLEKFSALPQLQQVVTDKDGLVRSIEELARKNLLLEPSLEAKRQTVLSKYELLTQMKAGFEKKMQRQHELSESCSASALQARLKVAAHEAEEESDALAEDFLEGKMEIDDFLSSFMEKRTICHCRRAKEEKLQQAIASHIQFHTPL
ncbi:vacuolar protein sorting-associated protein 37A [Petaurus breviceps papuanus]|uniref:vacuolar protein sorting-associated protein 37A n=1 Tax=Petaurus breviceps papuanus TaxID=3040969 RepID=UPI0036DC05C6